jgi:hypothetical protein
MGGDLLGGILGGGSDDSAVAWDEAGYSSAAGFEAAYPDEYADEMGEVIPFGGEVDDEAPIWPWLAAGGGAALLGLYMWSNRTTKKGDRRRTARRAYQR